MMVITNVSITKKNLAYSAKITLVNVSDYSKANICKTKTTFNMSLNDLFNNVCTNAVSFTKQCNKGFWYLNAKTLLDEAAKQKINLLSAEEYYNGCLEQYNETFGELYNAFVERYDNFTKGGRKVETSYM